MKNISQVIGCSALLSLAVWLALPGFAAAETRLRPAAASPSANRYAVELLENGGCEAMLVEGNIPGWQEVTGTVWTQRSANPEPYEGTAYFFAGVGVSAELRQDADVSGYADQVDAGAQVFEFSGWVRSWDQSPTDISQIILEYLNFDKSSVLASYDLGQNSNTDFWLHLTHSAIAPVGTRHIRVRLISIRRSGNNNDGYFDALSLAAILPDPATPGDLNISIAGNDVFMDWAPVTLDTAGNPVTVIRYDVYSGDLPEFVCGPATLAGTSTTPQITLTGWATGADRRFFRVIAVTD